MIAETVVHWIAYVAFVSLGWYDKGSYGIDFIIEFVAMVAHWRIMRQVTDTSQA